MNKESTFIDQLLVEHLVNCQPSIFQYLSDKIK